ncbi:MAG: glycosyltransferase [Spirochaetota bacterium]|nr:glycosyltransferase [Spirochaetota bacterium]
MSIEQSGFHPKVSIVIPVYNGSNYMREAIDSALAQTYDNIEVIVVNDGSNDDGKTDAIAKSYGNKIRYFYKENGGVSTALNLGIKNMTGEYFSWLSHDDIYKPEKTEVQINYLSKYSNKNIILYSDFDHIDNQSKFIDSKMMNNPSKPLVLQLFIDWPINGCSLLMPKTIFKNVGLFNEELKTTQDYEMWFKLIKEGCQFIYIPKSLIQSRVHKEMGTILLYNIQSKEAENLYIWALNLFTAEISPYFKEIAIALRLKKWLRKASIYTTKLQLKKNYSIYNFFFT